VWQQLYVSTDRDWTRLILDEAARLEFGQVLITVDRPTEAYRPRSVRHGGMGPLPDGVHVTSHRGDGSTRSSEPGVWDADLDWASVAQLIDRAALPVGVKGVLRGDDARRAVDAGVSSIVVSNHGGRQIDGVVSSADALVEVVAAVEGAVPVLVDGGIGSDADVFCALALGASAVLVGRPYLWALATEGQSGVENVIETLTTELAEVMSLAGATNLKEISDDLLRHV
jgi:isopentenyl diphosphate isomerase/L-lactate dehydrogenase-like FMN-dependent dehydrogenase